MDSTVIKYLEIQLNTLKCNSYLSGDGLKFHYPDSSLIFCLQGVRAMGQERLALTVTDRDSLDVDVLRQFNLDYKQMLKEHGINLSDFLADFDAETFALRSGSDIVEI